MGKPEELGMSVETRTQLREGLARVRKVVQSSGRLVGGLEVHSSSDIAILHVIDVLDLIVARLP